jgi:hypothetical protein
MLRYQAGPLESGRYSSLFILLLAGCPPRKTARGAKKRTSAGGPYKSLSRARSCAYPLERFLMSRASFSISSALRTRFRLNTLMESVFSTSSFNSDARS